LDGGHLIGVRLDDLPRLPQRRFAILASRLQVPFRLTQTQACLGAATGGC
jgi:hypothetical protein